MCMKTVSSHLLSSLQVTACFTTRHGGVSVSPFNSANLAFHVGDDPSFVLQNHDLLAKKMNYERHRLIHMRQIHSDHITIVQNHLRFDTPPQCDALITNTKETPLMVMSADCTPILIYDPIHHACAAIHAGRAGALNQILPKTIQKMGETFSSSPENLQIALGPSIHGCCYEINEAIAKETEEKGYPEALRRVEKKVFLDVNTILLQQLHTLLIQPSQIELIDDCTSCKHEEYFSYRADTQQTGRIAGVIILR